MGRYLELGVPKGKADVLVTEHDATLLGGPPESFSDVPAGKTLICVVDNGPFEAAAICFDELEFETFNAPDDTGPPTKRVEDDGTVVFTMRSPYQTMGMQRPRKWLLLDNESPLLKHA